MIHRLRSGPEGRTFQRQLLGDEGFDFSEGSVVGEVVVYSSKIAEHDEVEVGIYIVEPSYRKGINEEHIFEMAVESFNVCSSLVESLALFVLIESPAFQSFSLKLVSHVQRTGESDIQFFAPGIVVLCIKPRISNEFISLILSEHPSSFTYHWN